MSLLNSVKYWCGGVVERNPYSQYYIKKLLLRIPALLPHDRSYLGLRHCVGHPNKLFLDVGANDGISAMSFRRIDRTFDILSIEPNICHETTLRWLKERLMKFDYRIVAAGDEEGALTLFTPVYHRIPLHTAASLDRAHAEAIIHRWMPRRVAGNVRYEEQTVPVVRLDSLGLQPGIVKIDAEGFDHRVLAGMRETIVKWRPFMLCEIHPETEESVRRFCADIGFVCLQYDDRRDEFQAYTGSELRNVYCVPEENAAFLPGGAAAAREAA